MTAQPVYLPLVLYTLGLRIFEIFLSRRHQAELRHEEFERKDSAANFRSMVAVHALFFFGLFAEPVLAPRGVPEILWWSALAIFIAAGIIRFAAIRALGTYWNVNIMAPRAAGRAGGFIAAGPYQYIRHPNYLAVILEIAALPVLGGAYLTALVVSVLNALVLVRRIRDEERELFQIPGYEEQMGLKPRFIPFRIFSF